MKKPITWVIAIDGKEARFFARSNGNGLDKINVITAPQPDAERGRHVLGRVFESATPARHTVEPTKENEEEVSAYTSQIANYLENAANNNEFDRLVISAPPKLLGSTRKYFGKRIKEKIMFETHKDFANLDGKQILEHLNQEIVI